MKSKFSINQAFSKVSMIEGFKLTIRKDNA